MQRIVVAIDGSEPSRRALGMAVEVASKFGAQLRIVTVVEPAFLPPESYGLSDQVDAARRDDGRRVLEEALERAREGHVAAEAAMLSGTAADAIARDADQAGAGLVVVGSRGRGAVGRLLLGSVSSRLAHQLGRPLLVVP